MVIDTDLMLPMIPANWYFFSVISRVLTVVSVMEGVIGDKKIDIVTSDCLMPMSYNGCQDGSVGIVELFSLIVKEAHSLPSIEANFELRLAVIFPAVV